MRALLLLALAASHIVATTATAAEQLENFDRDPDWRGFRNRLVPNPIPVVRQSFGYRPTHHAGGRGAGEIGGWIQRSMTPAAYAKIISPKTFADKLTASGRLAMRKNSGNSGMLFGWFHSTSRGWRMPNSIVFRLDGNGDTYWVLFEYGTSHWLTGGGATFEGRYQTTRTPPFAADGTAHQWKFEYDPDANDNQGGLRFVFDGREFTAELLPEHKADGAVFDRFGMVNQQNTGGGMEVYFDDLVIDGESEEFSVDPRWDAQGNEAQFEERTIRPMHDFGYSATAFAGGEPGEIGGVIWRDEPPAYYAGSAGPFTLEDELVASGKLVFSGAGSDSGVYLGWFNGASKEKKVSPDHQEAQKNILAVAIEGPSRIGHYFRPAYSTARGNVESTIGPLIRPDGQRHNWSLRYSPAGANGAGLIIVALDGHEQQLPLKPGDRKIGATFDRFGFFNMQTGGHYVRVYVDDLRYSKARE
jgi:hypothetical protein